MLLRLGRSSHEERGLKYTSQESNVGIIGRSSHEERGLKSFDLDRKLTVDESLLSRGAWIEIAKVKSYYQQYESSLLSRGAWIEIGGVTVDTEMSTESLLSRGAWIEMSSDEPDEDDEPVAPLTRSVD